MSNASSRQREQWRGLVIAVVGGDEREQEIARLAATTGATVRAFGFPWPPSGVDGVTLAPSAAEAMTAAAIALFPIPGMTVDGAIFATEKIIPAAELLSVMQAGAHLILGKADRGLVDAAIELGITLHEYEADRELMLLRTPAIVEGALKVAIEHTVVTIHHAHICIVGQGTIGSALTRTLIALGARVTVAARNPVQRAAAYTLGAASITLEQLAAAAPRFDMIISTVPAPLVNRQVIDALPRRALVMDVSAPPGGADLEYASATGRSAVWARALGRRAPITVGASQWHGIAAIINDILEEQ